MAIWLQILEQYNGITFFRQIGFTASNEINMCSDASKIGFGATYGSKWIQARWPEDWTKLHITILELYPIYVIVAMFSNLIRNSNNLFHCDNSVVVSIINQQFSTDSTIMSILRPLVLILMKNNVYFRAKHLPDISNVLADNISRFQVDASVANQVRYLMRGINGEKKYLNVGKMLIISSLCRLKCKSYLRSKIHGERDYKKSRNPFEYVVCKMMTIFVTRLWCVKVDPFAGNSHPTK